MDLKMVSKWKIIKIPLRNMIYRTIFICLLVKKALNENEFMRKAFNINER